MSNQPDPTAATRAHNKSRIRSVFQRLDLEIALREAEAQHDHAEACRSFVAAMEREDITAAVAERSFARVERARALLQELASVRIMIAEAGHALAFAHAHGYEPSDFEPSDFEPTLALRLRPSERTLAAERMEAGAVTVAELAAEHGRRLEAAAAAERAERAQAERPEPSAAG